MRSSEQARAVNNNHHCDFEYFDRLPEGDNGRLADVYYVSKIEAGNFCEGDQVVGIYNHADCSHLMSIKQCRLADFFTEAGALFEKYAIKDE